MVAALPKKPKLKRPTATSAKTAIVRIAAKTANASAKMMIANAPAKNPAATRVSQAVPRASENAAS